MNRKIPKQQHALPREVLEIRKVSFSPNLFTNLADRWIPGDSDRFLNFRQLSSLTLMQYFTRDTALK
jgi:hypothetical protein